MFRALFSFNGRIGRVEYAITFICYIFVVLLINTMIETMPLLALLLFPILWILWAQGAKRCHDQGKNGWYQIIPLYFIVLIFVEGDTGLNKYDTDKTKTSDGMSDVLDSHE